MLAVEGGEDDEEVFCMQGEGASEYLHFHHASIASSCSKCVCGGGSEALSAKLDLDTASGPVECQREEIMSMLFDIVWGDVQEAVRPLVRRVLDTEPVSKDAETLQEEESQKMDDGGFQDGDWGFNS
jgi:hypothetical protein